MNRADRFGVVGARPVYPKDMPMAPRPIRETSRHLCTCFTVVQLACCLMATIPGWVIGGCGEVFLGLEVGEAALERLEGGGQRLRSEHHPQRGRGLVDAVDDGGGHAGGKSPVPAVGRVEHPFERPGGGAAVGGQRVGDGAAVAVSARAPGSTMVSRFRTVRLRHGLTEPFDAPVGVIQRFPGRPGRRRWTSE